MTPVCDAVRVADEWGRLMGWCGVLGCGEEVPWFVGSPIGVGVACWGGVFS